MDSNISFTGLTSSLRKTVYKRQEIVDLVKKYPKSKGFVGNLMPEWIAKIPKEQRGDAVKDIYDQFSLAVKQRQNHFFGQKPQDTIKNVLCKYKIITPETKVKFSQKGMSDTAELYRLQVGDKSYITKIFSESTFNNFETGGNLIEQNHALYLNAKPNSDWAKFYFGNLKDGYMVTEYISNRRQKPDYILDLGKKGLEYTDKRLYSFIKKKNTNYGGLQVIKGFPINNKNAVREIKKLQNLSAEEQLKKIEEIKNNTALDAKDSKVVAANYMDTFLKNKKNERKMNRLEEFLFYLIMR